MSEQKIKSEKSVVKSTDLINQTNQAKLDHEQHYDMDGVTQKNGGILIPSNFKIQNNFFKKSDKYKSTRSEK